tara:strand:+ start:306 stop:590 length:285 start_codon:yes stop_codon:yes gene_type:complete
MGTVNINGNDWDCDTLRQWVAATNAAGQGAAQIPWVLEGDRACRAAGYTRAPNDPPPSSSAKQPAPDAVEPLSSTTIALGIVGLALGVKFLRGK